jgi:hypothetical protein
MDAVNNIFYNITDKIIELQSFFLKVASTIGGIILLIAILMAALNYALTGTGLKENIIKIGKAFVFFSIVLYFYPNIIAWITDVTFSLAKDSTAPGISANLKLSQKEMEDFAEEKEIFDEKSTYGAMALRKYENFFGPILNYRTLTDKNGKDYSYSTVAPAAAMKSVLLVAGECFRLAEEHKGWSLWTHLDTVIPQLIKGYTCAFFIIVVGCFCVLEYLIAFIEFMFVSSVGVILFPTSLWDGTKFIAEKYIGAMLGFFMKLLFCTICIFLMLYVFTSLSSEYTKTGFTGEIEQMATVFFTCLLTFYISKSAPALAQGLLSGSASLTGAGAIGMVASSVMAIARLSHMGTAAGAAASISQKPSVQTSATGGSGSPIVNNTPPAFSLETPSGSISPTSQQGVSIDNHAEDLTRSLTSNYRPTEGGSSVPVVVHPAPYLPGGGQQALSFGGYSGQQSFNKAPAAAKDIIKGN